MLSNRTLLSYTDARTRAQRELVGFYANRAMAGRAPSLKPISLTIHAYLPIPKSWSQKKQTQATLGEILPTVKPDFDNLQKLVADALNGIIYKDDCQIVTAFIFKEYSRAPATHIEVLEVG